MTSEGSLNTVKCSELSTILILFTYYWEQVPWDMESQRLDKYLDITFLARNRYVSLSGEILSVMMSASFHGHHSPSIALPRHLHPTGFFFRYYEHSLMKPLRGQQTTDTESDKAIAIASCQRIHQRHRGICQSLLTGGRPSQWASLQLYPSLAHG